MGLDQLNSIHLVFLSNILKLLSLNLCLLVPQPTQQLAHGGGLHTGEGDGGDDMVDRFRMVESLKCKI